MDRPTIEVYEQRAEQYLRSRRPVRAEAARCFGERVRPGGLRLDAGCGPGRYTGALGHPVVALDAAAAMLELARRAAPHALAVRADLEALPFRRGAFAGAWANMSYLHVPSQRLPLALADLHRTLEHEAVVELQVLHGVFEGRGLPQDDLGGRFFAAWRDAALLDALTGAGLTIEHLEVDGDVVRATCRRSRTLADTVGPSMRLLVCGLNPSVYAADRGVPFARPGNRFWPAARLAGVVERELDPRRALLHDGVGMTDLCKRATAGSAELSAEEYREGAARVERLVAWLRPAAVCFVGLEGWRAAIDRGARPGVQDRPFGGRPAYLMPSTSGRNASSGLGELVAHLRAAATLSRQAEGDLPVER